MTVGILVIDDNAGGLQLPNRGLSQPELQIFTTPDPAEALGTIEEILQIVPANLMVRDISGIEILKRIMQTGSSTDVVLMAAHYSHETGVAAIKKGACEHLNTPVSIATLRDNVLVSRALKSTNGNPSRDAQRTVRNISAEFRPAE